MDAPLAGPAIVATREAPAAPTAEHRKDEARGRLRVAFFDFPDVFEDFYPHVGVTQQAFATYWADTGAHAIVRLVQRTVGDVTWYALSLAPQLASSRTATGFRVRIVRSSWLHRRLWQIFYLSRTSWRWRDGWFRPYATIASWLAPAGRELRRALREDRPDVFLVQEYSSGRFDILMGLAHLLGVPLITYHAGGVLERYVGTSVRRWTLPRADCVVASSRSEMDMLATHFRVAPARLAVVLTPIDTEVLRPIERDTACLLAGLSPARRHVLFVGRLDDPVKRVSSLIRAFTRLASRFSDADLVIVGDGPDGPRLRKLAEDAAPDRVRFLGWRSGAETLAPLYAAAECLVLPSMSEGFPTVVGEAMACGTPVLASDVGGVSEIVTPGLTGWLVPAGDEAALEDALAHVLESADRVAAMRPDVRAAAQRLVAPDVVAAAWGACFERVVHAPV